MSLDELLRAVDELSKSDLDHLTDRVLLVRARHYAPVATAAESSLLREINRGIPAELQVRYEVLADKRDDETLTEAEQMELLDIGDQMERIGVNRLAALVQLAQIRQVSLLQLMADLGIQSPDIR
jgi:hypothetical protein